MIAGFFKLNFLPEIKSTKIVDVEATPSPELK